MRMRLPFSSSTQIRIGLTFGILALVTFAAVAAISGASARQQVMADAGASLGELATRLSATLDAGMFERYREIQNIAHLEAPAPTASDPAPRWRAVVNQLQDTYAHYAWIGLADARGRVIAATDGLLEGHSVAQRPWFVQGRSGPFVGDVHDAVLLASLLPRLADSDPLRLVDVAAPVMHDGELLGVLGAHLSWAWAEEQRRDVLAPIEASRGVEIIVTTSQGERLLGPRHLGGAGLDRQRMEQLLGSASGFGLETWPDGRFLTAAVRGRGHLGYPGLGWTVLVRQPLATAVAPAAALQWRIAGIGLAGSLLFALAAWWLAGRLTAPLRDVAYRARALTEGSRPAPAGTNEVAQLSQALGTLVAQLRGRESELLQLNATLEERVQARTLALEAANEDLQAFGRTVSHDLKGPIGALGSAARHVADHAHARLDQRLMDMLHMMGTECDRLVHLVDELMMLSRLDQCPLRREPLDLAPLVEAVIVQVLSQPGAPPPGTVTVEVGLLPPVVGDAVLLRQVWHNLIANAVKFSARQPAPRVEISADVQGQDAVFHVCDNGAGFDMRLYDRLFGVFERLHPASEFPGSGVGLTIVKRVVQRHGGRVWAEATPGRGACFHFTLPLQPPTGAGAVKPLPAPQAANTP